MVKRSPNATLTSKVAIDQATAALQDLPDKPKENVSLREAVDLLQDDIIAALNKGYSYEEMTEVLAKQGISIAPSSLKHYLARSKRQSQPKSAAKTRQPRSTKKAKAEEPVVEAVPAPAPVEEPAEAKPRRTRSATGTKSAAKTKTSRATTTRKGRGRASS